MDHESLPDEHIEGPADYVVVYRGGPNHGHVLRADDVMSGVPLMTRESGLLPNIGDSFQTASIRWVESSQSVGPELAAAAMNKAGIEQEISAAYQVESISDGIIVLAHRP